MKRFLLASSALLLASSVAFATPSLLNSAPVQQDPSRLDAAVGSCSQAPAINQTAASTTCTITPPAGYFVYIDSLMVYACSDGTASVSSIQQNFTSTNLSGLAIETALITGSTITTDPGANLCDRVTLPLVSPLKSAQAGLAVTIVPPAQAAHVSFGQFVGYHFAP